MRMHRYFAGDADLEKVTWKMPVLDMG